MSRISSRTVGLVLGALLVAAPASAQVVHSLNLGGGAFFPRGEDTRAEGDVLLANLTNRGTVPGMDDSLLFFVKDFRSGQFTGEWTIGFGSHVEVAAGVGFYNRKVPSIYRDFVFRDPDTGERREIAQDLRLRVVPLTAVARFLLGRPGNVQPYVGAGVGLFNYRYSEIGEFLDTSNPDDVVLFDERYIAKGNAPGALLLGGIRFPLGGDIYGLNLEYRYQFAKGDTGGADVGFLGDKIDMSGGNLTFSFMIRF